MLLKLMKTVLQRKSLAVGSSPQVLLQLENKNVQPMRQQVTRRERITWCLRNLTMGWHICSCHCIWMWCWLSHLKQVFHWWILNAKLSLPGRLLLLFPGKAPGKQHWERGSSPAGQRSALSFPMVFFLKANELDQSAEHVDTKLAFR